MFEKFLGKGKDKGRVKGNNAVTDEFVEGFRRMQEKGMRIVMRMKCKTPDCRERRRDGSAFCQGCSDKHKHAQKVFNNSLRIM